MLSPDKEDDPDQALEHIVNALKSMIERRELKSNLIDVAAIEAVVVELSKNEEDLTQVRRSKGGSMTQGEGSLCRTQVVLGVYRKQSSCSTPSACPTCASTPTAAASPSPSTPRDLSIPLLPQGIYTSVLPRRCPHLQPRLRLVRHLAPSWPQSTHVPRSVRLGTTTPSPERALLCPFGGDGPTGLPPDRYHRLAPRHLR